jgi:hypothetical protein
MSKYPQLTLRELMLGVFFVGLGCAGLVAGGLMATIVLGVVLITIMGVGIVAFVGRDEVRAAAIGFLIPVFVYSVSIYSLGSSELDPYEGKLPTTKLIEPAFRVIVRQEFIDAMTGEPMPGYDPTTAPVGGGGSFGLSSVSLKETPDRTIFMSVAHALLAMVLGYAGSKFAVYVYHRQKPPVKAVGTG